jgi:hypothetical protein
MDTHARHRRSRSRRTVAQLALLAAALSYPRGSSAEPGTLAVFAGAEVPIFSEYTTAGAAAGARWFAPPLARAPRVRLGAGLGLQVIAVDGARRATTTLAALARFAPVRGLGLYLLGGVGAAGYVERVRMELGPRQLDSRDVGAALVGTLELGWQLTGRFEVSAGWQHNVVHGAGLAFPGTVVARIGGAL